MKFLLTGATGFIGKHLVDRLSEDGYEILIISRTLNKSYFNASSSQIHIVNSSLDIKEKELEIIKKFAPDIILHLAWGDIPDFSFSTSFQNIKTQINFFHIILNAIPIKKIVATGTCLEYGKKFGECKESEVSTTNSYFTFAKNTIREFLDFESKRLDFELIWARLFYVYGPGQREGSLIPKVINDLNKGSLPSLNSPFDLNDFIFISDVVEGLTLFSILKINSGIYNLGKGEAVANIEVVSRIEKLLHSDQILTERLKENSINVPSNSNFYANMLKTSKTLNWHPKVSITEGIEKCISKIYF